MTVLGITDEGLMGAVSAGEGPRPRHHPILFHSHSTTMCSGVKGFGLRSVMGTLPTAVMHFSLQSFAAFRPPPPTLHH
jgi:hypothetical protein